MYTILEQSLRVGWIKTSHPTYGTQFWLKGHLRGKMQHALCCKCGEDAFGRGNNFGKAYHPDTGKTNRRDRMCCRCAESAPLGAEPD